MTNQQLIADLTQKTEWCLQAAKAFLELSDETLNQKEAPDRWSILECLEHLNRYSAFYVPTIESTLKEADRVPDTTPFFTGWLGNKFALSMRGNGEGTPMKTFKKMDPNGSSLRREVLLQFIRYQEETLRLLPACAQVDLTKNKTGITLTRHIRLRLGDTLRVVIYHNERHVQQAQGVLQNTGSLAA